jgi:T4 RnlA family RNA ligase
MFLEKLHKYLEEGLVMKQIHPTLPLTIWNYTPKTQYDNLWDEVTLMCRGLVTDNDGNIVARPFKKFFNIEEGKHISTKEFEVFEKMDGSLGIMFKYNGLMVCATRGSFTSEQSVWMNKFADEYNYQNIIVDGFTYLFELIFPQNRIVVDYGNQERMVLLGIIKTESGEEVPYDDIFFGGWDVVEKYDGVKDYTTLKNMVKNNHEGFVVRFSNGDRMKVKGEEYIRLHKIMTNISTTSVWEILSNGGKIEDFLNDVPDEFYEKIKKYENNLKYEFYQIKEYCGKLHDNFRYGKYNDKYPEPTKKEFAEFVNKNLNPPELKSVIFKMWDKKPYEPVIWKLLKPKFTKL